DLFLHRQAEPAIVRRDRQPEEPKLAHLCNDAVRHEIVARHLVLDRDQPFADKASDGADQLFAGFMIERHDAGPEFGADHSPPRAPNAPALPMAAGRCYGVRHAIGAQQCRRRIRVTWPGSKSWTSAAF